MPTRPRRGADDWDVPEVSQWPVRRVEGAVSASVRKARGSGKADPRYAAVEALARSVGRTVDIAVYKGETYAVAQLSPKLMEILTALHLTPASNTAPDDGDGLAELLADLARPE
ncbi:hypothetical protein AB0J38_00195 [Streptomyces sp. NPDC050095]|uniref:hypothetical protein n=1 Tax=unclassified Streptomyces TaxID=2593676 RepID=UPI0034149E9B